MRLKLSVLAVALGGVASPLSPRTPEKEIILATTTSTRDTGLLDSLLPPFERQTGYTVEVIAVGSGEALALGRRGDADVVLSHAPEAERALVDSGFFIRRRLVMHNDFLIVGPPKDPAGLRGMNDVGAALLRLVNMPNPPPFISRGDMSGTHQRELHLWAKIGKPVPKGAGWYLELGQGMAAALQMADQKEGYTLTDRGTYLAWRDHLDLVPMVEGDPFLYNVYHVLELNPKNSPRINVAGGRALADYLVSADVQREIGEFGRAKFGQSLFVPDAGKPDTW